MTAKNTLLLLPALFLLIVAGSCRQKHRSLNQLAFEAQKSDIIDRYPKVPHDEILQENAATRLYGDLQERYKAGLIGLKNETDNDCARLIVVILTPEVGKSATLTNTYGIPYILKTCDNLALDFYNLSDSLGSKDITSLTLLPDEGGWTKEGAAYVADLLGGIITRYDSVRSTIRFSAGGKPATFGDMTPNLDNVEDGENNTPYHVKTNSQGLRMSYNITFPKTRQTILILGDGQIFNPFLDNDYIATTLLQKRFPDKVIINAAMVNYTMDDYESLYREKARYTEPDLVLVCTNGGDILEHFFSQRNHYSRSMRIYRGSDAERSFYFHLYKEQQ